MPIEKAQGLQKLQFRPGVNREGTSLANEGGWFQCDKIRFRSGYPEKIGGWVQDTGTYYNNSISAAPPAGSYWGVCRSLWNWFSLSSQNLLALGTNLKYYIQNSKDGLFYDITPIRYTSTVAADAFKTTNGSTTVTVTDPAHGAINNDFVTISGVGGAINGIPANALNREFQITYLNSNQYNIITSAPATSDGTTGSATFTYQINTGLDIYTVGTGWGAGTWGGVVSGSATTALDGGINSSATSIVLVDSSVLTSSGTIVIDAESITYSANNTGTNTLTVTTRGANGSTAAAHLTGATVTQVTASFSGWGQAASGAGVGQQLRLWSQSNYGEDLIFNPRGGALYYWAADANPNIFNPGVVMAAGTTVNGALMEPTTPSVANLVLVSDSSRFVIAFGTNDPTGVYATIPQDPLQIRWSNQEQFNVWTPAATNQAGDYRLSRGSKIIAAQQTRQEILVWTDAAVYSMQYLGPPYVWGFQIMGDNISIAGPNVASTANNVTYWMGTDKFYMYSGRVETLPCTLRQYVYDDINIDQAYQFFSGTNEGYNEIWWFYCSAGSTVVDKYVVFNHLERTWYYGTMSRTAWLDSPLRAEPMASTYSFLSFTGAISGTTLTVTNASGTGLGLGSIVTGENVPVGTRITAFGTGTGGNGTYTVNTTSTVASSSMVGLSTKTGGILLYHETGNDDGTTTPASPINAYVQSSDFDIGDGHNFGMVWRIIPDVTFDGSDVASPSLDFTVRPRQNPGSNYGSSDNPTVTSVNNYSVERYYNVQQFTQFVYVRIRGRQMAFKVSSNDLGVAWQLGTPRLELRPDGRR